MSKACQAAASAAVCRILNDFLLRQEHFTPDQHNDAFISQIPALLHDALATCL